MQITGFRMTAVGQPLELVRYDATPGPGEALVEVAGCGVCHTDLGFLYDGVPTRHPLPLVLGHEVAGRVVGVGPDTPDLVGQAVVVPAVIPCGECELCRRGRGRICPRQVFPGSDVDGGFASHLVVPARGLCRVTEESLDGLQLAYLSVAADAVSTAYQAICASRLSRGDLAIFVGAGGVGGFGIQIAHHLGARVVAIDVDPQKLAAMEEHGADVVLDPRQFQGRELRKAVRRFAHELGAADVEWRIFEMSGTPAGQQTAFALLTHGAHLAVVGYTPHSVELHLSKLMAFDATLQGNWGCLPELYPEVLEIVTSGAIQVAPFVEAMPMSRINEVLSALHAGQIKKRPVLLPDFEEAAR